MRTPGGYRPVGRESGAGTSRLFPVVGHLLSTGVSYLLVSK